MKIEISINLNEKGSLNKGIKELKAYRIRIQKKTALLVQKLIDYGADIARVKIVDLKAYYSGELLSGVGVYFSPSLNAGFIKVTSDHAAFVEFGTGIKGYVKSHPNGELLAKAAWEYGSGETIFNTKDGLAGWYFPMDDGTWRFTEGMESRPFMYETALELQRDLLKITKEVFST